MASPTVTIIIPTYNRAHLLPRAIKSAVAQTVQDFEVIVVDDGSTDDTDAVVAAFADPRITYLRHDRNRGPSAARNTGLRAARGDYIAFLDSDDEWLSSKLERQLAVFHSSELDNLGVVSCGILHVEPDRSVPVVPAERGSIHEDLLAGKGFRYVTYLVRRSVWHGEFDEQLFSQEDWDYLLRASKHCQVDFVSEPLVIVDRTPHDHLHGNVNARIDGYLRFLAKHSGELAARPRVLSAHYRAVARWCYLAGSMPRVRHLLWRAIWAYPQNIRLYPWLVASYLGALPFRAAMRLVRVQDRRP